MEEYVSDTAMMRHKQIGCATRGGDASRATEDYAINLAREHQAELIFLYVVDVSFAEGRTGKFDIEIVAHNLHEIGELVLEQAKKRAKQKGVHARGEIREGDVAEEIQRFVDKHRDMTVLVLGHMSDELKEHLQPLLQPVTGKQRTEVVTPPLR
jgi:nucleotide-binding universal stress UspA family protein